MGMLHTFYFLPALICVLRAQVQVDVSAKITYMERCDFWGKDFERRDGTVVRLYNIRDSSTCGLICLLAPDCTHFTWTNEHGCLPKHSKAKQEALETKRWHSYAKCGMVESRFSSHGGDEETTTITTAEFTSGTEAATEIGMPTDISALQTETEEVVSRSTAAATEISTPTDASVPQSETEEMISDVTAAATEISPSIEESTPQAETEDIISHSTEAATEISATTDASATDEAVAEGA